MVTMEKVTLIDNVQNIFRFKDFQYTKINPESKIYLINFYI